MRLPFLQLDLEFINGRAATIAALSKLDRRLVVGMVADIFIYAIEQTSSDERPPDGVFVDPDAGEILESIAGWTGPRGQFIGILERARIVKKLDVGWQVKGLERYEAAWEKAKKARDRKAAWRLKQIEMSRGTSPGQDAGRPRDNGVTSALKKEKETYTNTYTEKEDVVSPAPPTTTPQVLELVPPKAKKERKKSLQERFVVWALETRREHLATQGLPASPDTETWGASRTNSQLEPLSSYPPQTYATAYACFLEDERPRGLDPPWPMWAFVQDFAKYVSRAQREGSNTG